MKPKFYFLFVPIIAVTALLGSCSDQVDPKTGFKEIYSLNCVIRGDSSFQVATITRSYDVSGFDPTTNHDNPFIGGADVKVFYNDSVYVFRDTTKTPPAGSNYTTPMHYYYNSKLRPQFTGPIKIQAALPNGKVLSSSVETFAINQFIMDRSSSSKIFLQGVIPQPLNFAWIYLGSPMEYYVAPELIILYSKTVNGNTIEMQKKVPLYYLNGQTPLYPPIEPDPGSIQFKMKVVDKAMEEISAGDSNKQNYTIESAVFRLFVLDKNLTTYYSAAQTFLDEFSVRVSQPDYTNIIGGLGIFGTYAVQQLPVAFDYEYVTSFGYRLK